mgnify:CR=1 FL=1
MKKLICLLKILYLDLKPLSRPWYQYFTLPNGLSNYRYVGERGKLRTELMTKAINHANLDENDIVLDVGSNAGVYGFNLYSKVNQYIGVELDHKFYRQAIFLLNQFKQYCTVDNILFLNEDILDSTFSIKPTTLILSKVIYHNDIKNNQNKLLNKLISSSVNKLIIQGHTTQGEKGSHDYIRNIVVDYGFEIVYEDNHYEYPSIIAVR